MATSVAAAEQRPPNVVFLLIDDMGWPDPKYDPQLAGQWWNRGSNKPLDLEAMRKRYETKRAQRP